MEVVVFGSINMDMIAEVPHRPEPNTTLGALKLDSMAGGKGANEAVAAARLGTDTFCSVQIFCICFKTRGCRSLTLCYPNVC